MVYVFLSHAAFPQIFALCVLLGTNEDFLFYDHIPFICFYPLFASLPSLSALGPISSDRSQLSAL